MTNQRLSTVWRIVTVFVLTCMVWWLSKAIRIWMGAGGDYDRTTHVLSAVLILSLVLPLIVFARKYVDKRSWAGLRLTSFKEGWKPFVFGGLSYLIPAGIALIIFVWFDWTEIQFHVSVGSLVLTIITLLILVFMYEALPEELIFRGYFYRNLNTSLAKWKAVGVQSLLFVLFAVSIGAALSVERIVFFFAVGIIIGMVRVMTENVWGAVGLHVAFQTMQQLFSPHNQELTSTTPGLMEIVILGIIPFSFAIMTLKLFVRTEPDWKEVDTE
ncbi:CPBP family intramembrane metalloprotease [Alkalihalobacillus oceani]|uniref:CPBP family intramembrane metalloprotease n=1 Tax=Halalkalibacter oceani TaxID=1653776 RepID=A0A9X2IMP7_9BACI|nr:CPBP family intramembrane glutamic endopeptidase [Halalkalibacter oceani]MCM3714109.1 CPBP family intramembrane metalloprotease [Halalkalibacter oceani]